jgi:hypothetical protein
MNRILQVILENNPKQRREMYRVILGSFDKRVVLSSEEVSSALDQLTTEIDSDVRVAIWNMLLRQPCDLVITTFCEHWLNAAGNTDRHKALRILRKCCPNRLEELYHRFVKDSSLLLKYEALLCHFQGHREDAALGMVDIFEDLPLYSQEEAEEYIVDARTPTILDRVQINASLRGGTSVYSNLASALEIALAKRLS